MKYLFNSSIFSESIAYNTPMNREIHQIVKDFGSPLYVFHEEEFCNNFIHLRDSFKSIYSNYIPAYSYKTNYTPKICKLVKQMGGYAEVVSDMEYTLAKKIGYVNKEIIYNGPCKGKLLIDHLLEGGISNIDNYDEADLVVSLAKNYPHKLFKVGIRLNLDIDAGYTSRFGIELDSPSFFKVVDILKKCPNIKLVGFHCHISRARSLDAWRKRIEMLLEAADNYIEGAPDYINVGSGMYAVMDSFLKKQFETNIPTYEEYAEVIGGAINNHYLDSDKKPILFSEPGTTVIAKYLSLITTVKNVKSVADKNFVTVDSSFYNLGEICLIKKVPYFIAYQGGKVPKVTAKTNDIMGYTCLEQDCLFQDLPGDLDNGDIIVFGNLGGYSIVSKPPFIQPNCRVLSYLKSGEFEEIKRAEKFSDIFKTFIL